MKTSVRYSILIVLMSFESLTSVAQHVTKSPEFLKAIENRTRTVNGLPGKNYWINHSDYDLAVNVKFINDTIWILGSGEITYFNASPDTLKQLVLRSYPNFFANGALRDFDIGSKNEVEPVMYSNLLINGDTIPADTINQRRTSTNIILKNINPIGPGEKAVIAIGWKYRMNPSMNLRQGIYADKAIFVAYWYPQVAVYDDIYGWDTVEYGGLTEFYNDFNNYKVKISLPSEYYVWGGGVLQNPEAVYSNSVLDKYNTALNGGELVTILNADDLINTAPNGGDKTWYFKSEHSPDFTFAASKSHVWDAKSLKLANGNTVFVSSVYGTNSKFYSQDALWACDAIEYLSEVCPGVPFPWPRMTVFNNMDVDESAMESPMMVNTGDQQTADMAREVTFHEIAHTYLPFLLGTNERRNAWMDEGWATYQGNKWSNGRPGTIIDMFRELFFQIDSIPLNSPLMVPSYQISGYYAETFHAYVRSSQAFMTLENQLGEKKMNEAWHLFTETWNGKHPSPSDFFAIVSKVAGEDINWLLFPWFYEFAYPDIAIDSVDTINGTITIRNIGGLPLPVFLKIKNSDSTTVSIIRKPEVFKNSKQCTIKLKRANDIVSIELGSALFFDKVTSNNHWRRD